MEDGADLQQIASDMTHQWSSNILHFVNRMRHQRALGGIAQQREKLFLPGLSMIYECNQGHESLDMLVHPVTEAPKQPTEEAQPQSNLDGYVAWIHHWYEFAGPHPDPSQSTYPIDLILNGYSLLDNYTPSAPYTSWSLSGATQNEAAILYVAMFGDTALRCESLQANNPVTLTQGGPFKVLPKRKQLPAGDLPNAGDTHPAHDDVFGYFVFNIFDPQNIDFFNRDWVPPPITYINGVHFKSSAEGKSPLKPAGLNQLDFQYRIPGTSLGNAIDYLFAEFYDRNSKRGVGKIWKPRSPDYNLIANDKPNYYTRLRDLTANQTARLTFDLSKNPTPDDLTALGDQPIGPFDAVDTFNGGETGLSAASFEQRTVTITADGVTWTFPPWT